MKSLRRMVKLLVPGLIRWRLSRVWGWRWFRNHRGTWAEARATASGYDSDAIVARVLTATLAVKAGGASFERDGVCFAEPDADAPLLGALRRVASACGGRLRVLDFGGALGSVYWRHRAELAAVRGLGWDIVEQPGFVEAGRRHFADMPLRFFATVDEAEAAGGHDVLLCSTALQYLEHPHATVEDWVERGWRFLLYNNLPLHRGRPDRLAVQHVPPDIYPASYPVWFFNRERMLAHFASRYNLLAEYASEAVWPVGWSDYPSTGMLFERKDLV
jgi:putative methyltransferase (TIGR04325 family)